MWQVMYMGMAFHWNVNADYDKLYEEANSLYYGKGWAGGMREFKKLLYKLFMEAPGCWGYGHSVPVGKFLDVPGAKEKLYSLLDSAEKAAAEDPHPHRHHHLAHRRGGAGYDQHRRQTLPDGGGRALSRARAG